MLSLHLSLLHHVFDLSVSEHMTVSDHEANRASLAFSSRKISPAYICVQVIIKKTFHFLILSVFSCFLHRSPFCKDIVSCRGDHVRLAVRVRVFTYPENACAVWLMFACKYCSVLWSTDTCTSKLQACLNINTRQYVSSSGEHYCSVPILHVTLLATRTFGYFESPTHVSWNKRVVLGFFSNVILAGFSTTGRAILFH